MAAWSAKVSTKAICLVREGLHLQAIDHDDAQQVITFEYRYTENRPNCLNVFRPIRVFWISQDIENIDRSAFERGAGRTAVPAGADRVLLYPRSEFRRGIKRRSHPQYLAVETEYKSPVRPTQSGRTLDNRFKYRLKIERRAADDLEHVGGGGLLLQRFAQFVEQPRVLDGDDGLSGEVCD